MIRNFPEKQKGLLPVFQFEKNPIVIVIVTSFKKALKKEKYKGRGEKKKKISKRGTNPAIFPKPGKGSHLSNFFFFPFYFPVKFQHGK